MIAGGLAEDDVRAALRRAHFRVREVAGTPGPAAGPGGPASESAASATVRYLYGDRHQYVKLATLLTHLGLIGFLVAASVTSIFGFEDGFLLPVGQATPVDRIGSPDLVTVKNLDFQAHRVTPMAASPTSRPTWPSTRPVARSPGRRSG